MIRTCTLPERTVLNIGKKWASKSRFCFLLATLCVIVFPAGAAAGQADGPQGEDFAADAKLLYRVVACGGNAAHQFRRRFQVPVSVGDFAMPEIGG